MSPSASRSTKPSSSAPKSASWVRAIAVARCSRLSHRFAAACAPLLAPLSAARRNAAATSATGIANGMEAMNKAVAKAADAASATCAGREVAGKATKAGLAKYSIYDVSKTVAHTLLLRYSQRRKLVRHVFRMQHAAYWPCSACTSAEVRPGAGEPGAARASGGVGRAHCGAAAQGGRGWRRRRRCEPCGQEAALRRSSGRGGGAHRALSCTAACAAHMAKSFVHIDTTSCDHGRAKRRWRDHRSAAARSRPPRRVPASELNERRRLRQRRRRRRRAQRLRRRRRKVALRLRPVSAEGRRAHAAAVLPVQQLAAHGGGARRAACRAGRGVEIRRG